MGVCLRTRCLSWQWPCSVCCRLEKTGLVCLQAEGLCCEPGDVRRMRVLLGLYLAELLKRMERGPGWHCGTVGSCRNLSFSLQGPQHQTAALAVGPLQETAGPQLGLVLGPNRTKVETVWAPGHKGPGPCGCASGWHRVTQGEASVSPAGPDHSCPTHLCSLLPALPPHPAP